MEGPRSKGRLAPALTVMVLVCAVLVVPVYAVMYFQVTKRIPEVFPRTTTRVFSSKRLARLFVPAEFLEARLTGRTVSVCTGLYEDATQISALEEWRFDP